MNDEGKTASEIKDDVTPMVKPRFVTLNLFMNHEAPLQFQFHSIPEKAFEKFTHSIEIGRDDPLHVATLSFPLPESKLKFFSCLSHKVMAIDTVFTPQSGAKAAVPVNKGPVVAGPSRKQ